MDGQPSGRRRSPYVCTRDGRGRGGGGKHILYRTNRLTGSRISEIVIGSAALSAVRYGSFNVFLSEKRRSLLAISSPRCYNMSAIRTQSSFRRVKCS